MKTINVRVVVSAGEPFDSTALVSLVVPEGVAPEGFARALAKYAKDLAANPASIEKAST